MARHHGRPSPFQPSASTNRQALRAHHLELDRHHAIPPDHPRPHPLHCGPHTRLAGRPPGSPLRPCPRAPPPPRRPVARTAQQECRPPRIDLPIRAGVVATGAGGPTRGDFARLETDEEGSGSTVLDLPVLSSEMDSSIEKHGSGTMDPDDRPPASGETKACTECHTTKIPLWRGGPCGTMMKMVNPNNERFRMELSDGVHTVQSMLPTSSNPLARDSFIKNGSIIHLQEFTCSTVQRRSLAGNRFHCNSSIIHGCSDLTAMTNGSCFPDGISFTFTYIFPDFAFTDGVRHRCQVFSSDQVHSKFGNIQRFTDMKTCHFIKILPNNAVLKYAYDDKAP